mgnify:FL=1|jgi:hypothetical protein
MMPAIEHDFSNACARFRRAEEQLLRVLDALAAARADERVLDITAVRMRAREAECEAMRAWDMLERSRAAYWRSRANEARDEIRRVLPPLLAASVKFMRFAGDSTAVKESIAHEIAQFPLPDVDLGTVIPWQPLESAVLARADNEVF